MSNGPSVFRAREVFEAALGQPPPARPQYVRSQCEGDTELADLVLGLLAEHEAGSNTLPPSAWQSAAAASPAPERIGNYRLLDRDVPLGKGGMGAVYRAQQIAPDGEVLREVAIKVIRPGLATRSTLARFSHETTILARLLHPFIATMYDAGMFDAGAGPQPYFAMELVQGKPLTEHAQEKKLSTTQRLELLVKICQAVQHAHGRGTIHRDLKPANILVTDDGQPKILDFGVARVTDSDVKTTTLGTDIGQLVGTLSYMSPEQAGGDPDDLDTRSDVYSLGVIAYELLANRMPYDLGKKMIHEAVRIIREDEPTRLSTVAQTLRGDLEVIVGKALEKEKDRRYQTAAAFGADIERYLADEPIAARPPSTWYQLSKFSRRNKGLVCGVIAAFVVLIVGLCVSLYLRSVTMAQNIELDRLRNALTDFVDRQGAVMRAAWDPYSDRTPVLKYLAEQVHQLDAMANLSPTLESQARQQFGELYLNVDARELARVQLERALQLRESKAHPDTLAVAETLDTLARALASYDDIDGSQRSLPHIRRAAQVRERILGSNDPLTQRTRGDTALYEAWAGGQKAAGLDSKMLEMLASARGKGETATQLGDHLSNGLEKIGTLWRMGRTEDAIEYVKEEAKPITDAPFLGERVPLALAGYAIQLQQSGRSDAASCLAEAAIRIGSAKATLSSDHPFMLFARSAQARIYTMQGRCAEAERILRPLSDTAKIVVGEGHHEYHVGLSAIAQACLCQGKYEEAEQLSSQAVDLARKYHMDRDVGFVTFLSNLAEVRAKQGKFDQAKAPSLEAIEKARNIKTVEPAFFLELLGRAASILKSLRSFDQAQPVAQECYEGWHALRGPTDQQTQKAALMLSELYTAWDRPGEAQKWRAAAGSAASAREPTPKP